MENVKEIINAIIIGAVIIGVVYLAKGCSENTDKRRMECIQAGKTPEECSRAFHN